MLSTAQSFKALAGAILLSLAGAVSATPLSDYNLILLGDLNANSIHVYDRAFIGGDITGGGSEFGSRMDRSTRENSLEVAGDIRSSGVTVQSGYMAVGGVNTAGNVNCNGNGLNQACVTTGTDLDTKADDLAARLYDDSLWLSSLGSNGDLFLADHNRKSFTYTGSDSVAVFNLAGTDLFGQNSNWSLNAGSAQTVIINVSGSSVFNRGGVNFNAGFGAQAGGNNIGASNILWNFYEATSIDFGSTRFNGSVLAPYADIRMTNDFDGSVAAKSYTGAGQVHNYLFNGAGLSRPPVSEVPEPPALLLMLMGLGLLGLVRLRRS